LPAVVLEEKLVLDYFLVIHEYHGLVSLRLLKALGLHERSRPTLAGRVPLNEYFLLMRILGDTGLLFERL
jgi:hypothetical protein